MSRAIYKSSIGDKYFLSNSSAPNSATVFGGGFAGGASVTGTGTTSSFGAYAYVIELEPDSSKKTPLVKAIESDPKAWFKITQFMVLMNGNLKDVEKKLGKQGRLLATSPDFIVDACF